MGRITASDQTVWAVHCCISWLLKYFGTSKKFVRTSGFLLATCPGQAAEKKIFITPDAYKLHLLKIRSGDREDLGIISHIIA